MITLPSCDQTAESMASWRGALHEKERFVIACAHHGVARYDVWLDLSKLRLCSSNKLKASLRVRESMVMPCVGSLFGGSTAMLSQKCLWLEHSSL